MKRSRKSKSVSWAPGVNLCQVKLFLTEECPSKVGAEHQDTLQEKTSWTLHPSGMCANDLPPGFEGGHYANGLNYDLAEVPRIQWTCPPKFVLNFNWHVVAAEESKEVEAQKLREMRVLEAVYPRLSAIPPNPSVSLDVEVESYDDSRTPLIPLNPIEDEEGADVSSDFAALPKISSNSSTAALIMPPGLSVSGTHSMPHCPNSAAKSPALDKLPGVNSEVIEAALAASIAATNCKEQGSLIDTDLLIKILSDPKMVEKLIHDLSAAANVVSTPVYTSEPEAGITSLPHPKPATVSSPMPLSAAANVVSTPLYTSEPETARTSLPHPKPATVSSPMPTDRTLNHLLKEFQPTSSVSAPRPAIVSVSMPKRVESSIPLPGTDIKMISGHRAANGNAYSTMNQVQPVLSMMPVQPNPVQNVQPPITSTPFQQNAGPAVTAMKVNLVKDANYIKNLIREHGSHKQEVQGHNISQTETHFNHIQSLKLKQNLKPVALKTKFQKPCLYFNSSKGCRNGSNCLYLHDKSFQCQTGGMMEAPSAKRMKFGREITGMI